jgi:hypothetical protein
MHWGTGLWVESSASKRFFLKKMTKPYWLMLAVRRTQNQWAKFARLSRSLHASSATSHTVEGIVLIQIIGVFRFTGSTDLL